MDNLERWRERVRTDPAVHHGDPCIVGTRVPVSVIVGSVVEGDDWEQILTSYPQLKRASYVRLAEQLLVPLSLDDMVGAIRGCVAGYDSCATRLVHRQS